MGISGGALNKNGTSRRANSQVSKFNREEGDWDYFAVVMSETMEGRAMALEWEKKTVGKVRDIIDYDMSKHKYP